MSPRTNFKIPMPTGTAAVGVAACADAARASANAATNWLCEPVEEDRLYKLKEVLRLFTWYYFNPAGPTGNLLVLARVPGRDEALLVGTMYNPFASWVGAYGLLPLDTALDPAGLEPTLTELFQRNGTEDYPLLGGLPSSVDVHPGRSPLPPDTARDIFLLAVDASLTASSDDLRATCALLERHIDDPWGEARTALHDIVEETRDAAAVILDPDSSPQERDVASREFNHRERPGSWSRPQVLRWWALVSDRRRIRAVQDNFSAAWHGAIALRRGVF